MNGLKICVVDDDLDQIEILKRMTAPFSCQVETFSDGWKALEWLLCEPVDLIISDVMMPDLDGWELHARVRDIGANRNTPFIFVTCVISSSQEGLMSDMPAGTLSLAKPLSRQRLLRAIQHLFNQAA